MRTNAKKGQVFQEKQKTICISDYTCSIYLIYKTVVFMAKTHVLAGSTEPDVNVGIACGLCAFQVELLMEIKW